MMKETKASKTVFSHLKNDNSEESHHNWLWRLVSLSCNASSNLNEINLEINTGVKPYSCKNCGRAFALQSHLLSHMRTHSQEKAFKCNTCGKAFMHQNTLSRHELIHTGIHPFKCDKCGKTFTQTNDLKRTLDYALTSITSVARTSQWSSP